MSFNLGYVNRVPRFTGHSAPRFIGRQLDMQYPLDSLGRKKREKEDKQHGEDNNRSAKTGKNRGVK